MNKHCSSIYFRCKTTVLVFTLSVIVMLLTDLTSAPDDKSIGIDSRCTSICQKNTKVYDQSETLSQRQPTRICSVLQQLVDHTHHTPPSDGQLGSLDQQHQTAVPSHSDEMVRQAVKDHSRSLSAAAHTTDANDTLTTFIIIQYSTHISPSHTFPSILLTDSEVLGLQANTTLHH